MRHPALRTSTLRTAIDARLPARCAQIVSSSKHHHAASQAVAEEIAEAGFSPGKKFKRIGIPDVFSDRYGSQANLMDYHHINTDTTVATVRALLERK